jgi:hypothetical protein
VGAIKIAHFKTSHSKELIILADKLNTYLKDNTQQNYEKESFSVPVCPMCKHFAGTAPILKV